MLSPGSLSMLSRQRGPGRAISLEPRPYSACCLASSLIAPAIDSLPGSYWESPSIRMKGRARFIAATADLSALGGCSDTQMNLLKLHHRARGRLKIHPLVKEFFCHLCCSDVKNHDYPHY